MHNNPSYIEFHFRANFFEYKDYEFFNIIIFKFIDPGLGYNVSNSQTPMSLLNPHDGLQEP